MTKGTYLSWIVVKDIKQARQFFRDVLGMKELSYSEEFKWAEFAGKEGGGMIGVAQESHEADVGPGSNAVVTFSVDNLIDEKKKLSAKGVKMLGEVIEVPGHVKMQTFCDKDGNRFQLVEELSSK